MNTFMEQLAEAAARGVEVTIVTNHHEPAPLRLKWHQTVSNVDAKVSTRAAGYELYVRDCDGDFSTWRVRRGRQVVAEGETHGYTPYYHCDAACLAAEAALRSEVRRRLEQLRRCR